MATAPGRRGLRPARRRPLSSRFSSVSVVFAATLGLPTEATSIFLAVSGAIAASFAFALPVATPPNAIVFGSGYLAQKDMMKAGVILNIIMTVVLTGLIWLLFQFVWPYVLW